jgi:hypothetical protein
MQVLEVCCISQVVSWAHVLNVVTLAALAKLAAATLSSINFAPQQLKLSATSLTWCVDPQDAS